LKCFPVDEPATSPSAVLLFGAFDLLPPVLLEVYIIILYYIILYYIILNQIKLNKSNNGVTKNRHGKKRD
jgi:hypothetical protein